MMTRNQLRAFAAFAGFLMALLACCFGCSRLILWFWAAPILFVAAVLLAVSAEKSQRNLSRQLRHEMDYKTRTIEAAKRHGSGAL
jgi:hypothetical protein